jgi:hypothetical protein
MTGKEFISKHSGIPIEEIARVEWITDYNVKLSLIAYKKM